MTDFAAQGLILLSDLGLDAGPIGLDDLKLVGPAAAIQWVAHRTFHHHTNNSVRDWHFWLPSALEQQDYVDLGKEDLAEQLLGEAITAGRIRCAIVSPSLGRGWGKADLPRIEIVNPSLFKEREIVASWEDGFHLNIHLSGQGDDAAYKELQITALAWADVLAIWPGSSIEETPSTPPLSSVETSLPRPSARQAEAKPSRSKKDHSAAIATFTLQLAAMDREAVRSLRFKDAGYMLSQVYEAMGELPPHPTDAGAYAAKVRKSVLAHADSARDNELAQVAQVGP